LLHIIGIATFIAEKQVLFISGYGGVGGSIKMTD
jgi:hypothetical protein